MPDQPHQRGAANRFLGRLLARIAAPQLSELRALRSEIAGLRKQTEQLSQHVAELRETRHQADRGLKLIGELRTDTARDLVILRKQLDKLLVNGRVERRQARKVEDVRAALEHVVRRQTMTQNDVQRQLAAVIRASCLPASLSVPFNVFARRFRLRSQNEEDGILLALLDAVRAERRTFVEIGSGASGGTAAVLAFEMGWGGLMLDGDPRLVTTLRQRLRSNPGVTVVEAMVTPENVNDLLAEHRVAGEVDLLSIDIDSVDYWVFDALKACTARVLVLEYNAHFGFERSVTVPKGACHREESYFGASLAALEKAARRKGYGLVLCEPAGVNAFFVRDGLAPGVPRLTPAQAYQKQQRGKDKRPPGPSDVFAALEAVGLPLVDV